MFNYKQFIKSIFFVVLFIVMMLNAAEAKKKPITPEDIMKIKMIKDLKISENGEFIGYTADPERGNPQAVVQATLDTVKYIVERGKTPVFSKDGKWAAMKIMPAALEIENEGMSKLSDDVKMAILNTSNGQVDTFNRVNRFVF